MNARQQLADAERLGDIVIGAEIQANNFVDFLPFGGEHHNRCGNFFGAELFADVVSTQARQHDIENDESGTMFGEGGHGLVASIANCHFETVALEDFFQAEKDVGIVFDNQDFGFHGEVRRLGKSVRAWGSRRFRSPSPLPSPRGRGKEFESVFIDAHCWSGRL